MSDEVDEPDDVAGGEPVDPSDGDDDEAELSEQQLLESIEFDAELRAVLDGDGAPSAEGPVGPSDVATERDEYRDALLRVKADFDNYRKRVAKEQSATVARANESLVAELLPVLDACEAAVDHGSDHVEPILKSLWDVLEKEGLERMQPQGQPFDPTLHEAVMHEPGDGTESEAVVADTMRSGYLWRGRVIRAAMVKVQG